jgi:hypothetical protein
MICEYLGQPIDLRVQVSASFGCGGDGDVGTGKREPADVESSRQGFR